MKNSEDMDQLALFDLSIKKIYVVYSKEQSQCDGSLEHPKQTLNFIFSIVEQKPLEGH